MVRKLASTRRAVGNRRVERKQRALIDKHHVQPHIAGLKGIPIHTA